MKHKIPAVLLIPVIICLTSCASKMPVAKNAATAKSLKEHQESFTEKIVPVTAGVYCATGYALSNSAMIVVNGGKVIVDATESVEAATEIKREFDRIAPGPVLAVIYTHTHADHILGADAFVEPGMPIWATDRAVQSINDQFVSMNKVIRRRADKQFGSGLDESLRVGAGIGPLLRLDEGPVPPIYYPTHTFSGIERLEIGGVVIELHQAPGETDDQLFVWLPGKKVLFPGDNVYAAFPNLYSTRGVPPRPIRKWIASLDAMRALYPEFMSPGHTQPVSGKERISEILTVYRDAIAYTHDSVIRMASEGKSPDDMAREIKLPPHLRDHPYLREFYGKLSWSVRGIYDGYLGWFDGNASSLARLHPAEKGRRMIPLLGGRENILAAANEALNGKDYQWAAELTDILLAVDAEDTQARHIKADALWQLGAAEVNLNARNYYFSSALELREAYEPAEPIINADTIKNVPAGVIIAALPERLDPAKSSDLQMSVAFEFTDTKENYVFYIRRGIGEIAERKIENPDLKFIATQSDFKAFLLGDVSGVKALATKMIRIEGGLSDLLKFKSLLIK